MIIPTPIDLATGDAFNEDAVDRLTNAVKALLRPPMVKVKRLGADIDIPNNSEWPIPWTTENWDTDGMWDPANPTLFTVRTAGRFACAACARGGGNGGAGERDIFIARFGAGFVERGNGSTTPGVAGLGFVLSTYAEFNCQVGETLGAGIYQNSGGPIPLQANFADVSFSARLISLF